MSAQPINTTKLGPIKVDQRERLPCDVCGKPLSAHSSGAGIPICPGIYAPGYRDRLHRRIAELLEALEEIASETVFNQQRYAEDTDTDYFLRCFKAVKERAHASIAKATRP